MTDKEKVCSKLQNALVQMHSPEGYEYTSDDVNELEMAAWDALNLLQESNLIKKKERVKLLPCRCGCKRREHWFAAGNDMQAILVCEKCGFEVRGKNEEDARRNWNEAVKNG